jgi:uncharacterized damage-inducible protein DinB
MSSLGQLYLENAIWNFRRLKDLAEQAFAQIDDAAYHSTLDKESNSIGVLVQHLSGNMLSRWTDIFDSDGEKPDRNRDAEFVLKHDTSKEQLLAQWQKGWGRLLKTLESLTPDDLEKQITINGKKQSVVESVNYHLVHYAQHIGQIVFMAKHIRSGRWESLSTPKSRPQQQSASSTAVQPADGPQTDPVRRYHI